MGTDRQQHDAEDLVQDTYLRVLAKSRWLRNDDDLGYMLRSLRNTFLTKRRDASRRIQETPLPDDPSLVPDDHAPALSARSKPGSSLR